MLELASPEEFLAGKAAFEAFFLPIERCLAPPPDGDWPSRTGALLSDLNSSVGRSERVPQLQLPWPPVPPSRVLSGHLTLPQTPSQN